MKNLIILIAGTLILTSCGHVTNSNIQKAFDDSRGIHIGDSFFVNGLLSKIIYTDSSLYVDSIVYQRYDNRSTLKQINMFKKGKKIFENLIFYENGTLKKYIFLGDKEDVYFERCYNMAGKATSTYGTLFFQGYVSGLNTKMLEAKVNTTTNISIFYPNPPDCNVRLYVRFADQKEEDVFYPSKYIKCLKTVAVDNVKYDNKIWNEIDVWIELREKSGRDSSIYYNKPLYYKVIN